MKPLVRFVGTRQRKERPAQEAVAQLSRQPVAQKPDLVVEFSEFAAVSPNFGRDPGRTLSQAPDQSHLTRFGEIF